MAPLCLSECLVPPQRTPFLVVLTEHYACGLGSHPNNSRAAQMLRALAQRALLLLLLTIRAPAQYTTGAVQGIILDPSGAIVAGANVVLRNSDTNEARTFQTAQDGIYSFVALRPGNYTLTVAAAGFAGSVV